MGGLGERIDLPVAVTPVVGRPRRPLYVSAVVGGGSAGNAKADAEVSRLARLVREAQDALGATADDPAEGAVDVIFHLAGPLLQPDYEGIRTGRFVKAKRLQVVQVAVPEGLDGTAVTALLSDALVEAVEIAARHFERRKVGLSLDTVRRIAARAAEAMKAGN